MNTTIETLQNDINTIINDRVTLDLIDLGYDAAFAYEAGRSAFNFVAHVDEADDLLDLDPVFYEVNVETIPWDKLQF